MEAASIGQENMTQILQTLHSNGFSANEIKKEKRKCNKFVCLYDTHDFYLDIRSVKVAKPKDIYSSR